MKEMKIDSIIMDEIETLRNAIPRIYQADRSGDPHEFRNVGTELGPIAWRVYRALRKADVQVMLPIWLIYSRAKSCEYLSPEDPGFWHHCDMIVGLCNFVDFLNMEVENASA